LPFEPKLVAYPFDVAQLIQYAPTALEHSYEYPLLTAPDLGVPLLLIDPDAYNPRSTRIQPLAPQVGFFFFFVLFLLVVLGFLFYVVYVFCFYFRFVLLFTFD
jgi:hypothetical protein